VIFYVINSFLFTIVLDSVQNRWRFVEPLAQGVEIVAVDLDKDLRCLGLNLQIAAAVNSLDVIEAWEVVWSSARPRIGQPQTVSV
jgi:hypothetical protein